MEVYMNFVGVCSKCSSIVEEETGTPIRIKIKDEIFDAYECCQCDAIVSVFKQNPEGIYLIPVYYNREGLPFFCDEKGNISKIEKDGSYGIIYLLDYGKELTTKQLGKQIRLVILKEYKKSGCVQVSFKGIVTATFECLNEMIGKILNNINIDKFKENFRFAHVPSQVEDIIKAIISIQTNKIN
jgi:hypothetical protein